MENVKNRLGIECVVMPQFQSGDEKHALTVDRIINQSGMVMDFVPMWCNTACWRYINGDFAVLLAVRNDILYTVSQKKSKPKCVRHTLHKNGRF